MTPPSRIINEFSNAGEMLFKLSLVGVKSGNLSLREGKTVYITRSGAKLGEISSTDIVSFALAEEPIHPSASTEAPVHLAIYKHTGYTAVAHVHPVYATAVASTTDRFVPPEVEGLYHLKGGVPVVWASKPYGSEELAALVSRAIKQAPCVLVRNHGAFIAAHSLERCVELADILERSSKIFFLQQLLQRGKK